MNNDIYVLAIDLGTSGAKVALISTSGKVVAWESQAVPLHLTPDGGAEQVPEDWWQAITTATKSLMAKGIVPKEKVVAVCASTQGEGTIAVDRLGRALTNCILWMDMRGEPYLRKRIRSLVNAAGYGVDKLARWIRLTGGLPSLTGKDPSAHMLFIKEQHPEIYAKTYKFLNVLDYLNLRLCGRFIATVDSILTSWVTDNRDPDNVRYDPTLVHYSGIDPDKFPEVVPCTAVLGNLTPDAANDLGLTPATKVVAGSIDNTAASIGSGAVELYQAHVYIGTSSWIAAHVPHKKTDIISYLASTPCAIPGTFLLTALQATAGGNLTFLIKTNCCRKKTRSMYTKSWITSQNASRLAATASFTPPGSGASARRWTTAASAPVYIISRSTTTARILSVLSWKELRITRAGWSGQWKNSWAAGWKVSAWRVAAALQQYGARSLPTSCKSRSNRPRSLSRPTPAAQP